MGVELWQRESLREGPEHRVFPAASQVLRGAQDLRVAVPEEVPPEDHEVEINPAHFRERAELVPDPVDLCSDVSIKQCTWIEKIKGFLPWGASAWRQSTWWACRWSSKVYRF